MKEIEKFPEKLFYNIFMVWLIVNLHKY